MQGGRLGQRGGGGRGEDPVAVQQLARPGKYSYKPNRVLVPFSILILEERKLRFGLRGRRCLLK
jgi:hypothetical protein